MITSLLSVPKQRIRQPLIQEVGDEDVRVECHSDSGNQYHHVLVEEEEEEEEDEIDWCLEEVMPEAESLLTGEKYGFANHKSNIFSRLGEEVSLAIDLKDPDTKSRAERREERLSHETDTFDEDYYLSCLYEDRDTIEWLIHQNHLYEQDDGDLDDTDLFDMKNLPIRSYLFDSREKKQLLFGLVDILFAYAYDWRTCEGEHTSESNWTMAKLSATLSWMETFHSIRDVIITCYRRALIFPLFRHHDLNVTVMKDVVAMMRKGRKSCLKRLLQIRRLFNQTPDCRYILNDLYISDYCVWVQRVKDKTFEKLASVVEQTMHDVGKADLGLDVDLLEKAASLTLLEQQGKSADVTCNDNGA
jgi:protein SHQ1